MKRVEESQVDEVHGKAVIIDGRDPTHLMFIFTREEKPDYYASIKEGGLTAILVDAAWLYDRFADMARSFATWYDRVRERNSALCIALSAKDIRKAKQDGKTAFILTTQNSDSFEEDVSLVPIARMLGLRCSQVVYQSKNPAGDGCGEKADSGLSKYGVDLVHAFNKSRIVIDLSHAGPQTAMEAVQESEHPVVFSHSNAKALCDAPRNCSDALLKALADRGGVVGASAYNPVIVPSGGETGATLDQFIDQIDYMVNLIGIDHVGFGLDAGEGRSELEVKILHSKAKGLGKAPKFRYQQDLTPRRKMKNLTRALLQRGYSEEDTLKILGGNFLRVFEQIWGE
jgi:membrane dipeptidase